MSALPLSNPIEVRNRLEQLRVTKEQLLEVVGAAIGARRNCTSFDPRSAPGWSSWREGNRRLREILVPRGWELDEAEGIPSVIHRSQRIKITMCNTDAGTGLKDHRPQQTSKKGTATDEIVSVNQALMGDILDSALIQNITPLPRMSQPGYVTCWYLCVYCEDDDVRAELSCPTRCEEGYFKDFHERIFLISDEDNGSGVKARNKEPDGGDAGFEIPVKRKQAL
jgi:hypothetical protein